MVSKKISIIVIMSIILTIILVSAINIGVSIFLESPEFEDFTTGTQVCADGLERCRPEYDNEDYNQARNNYNQIRFYIFVGVGLFLLIIGLFTPEIITRIVGLLSGGVLIAQGIVFNLQNKIAVFTTLIIVLFIAGFFTVRVIRKLR